MNIDNGYEYFYDPNHHLANKAGKVYVHRVVAERKIGRVLNKKEVVHHIDGNRCNNSPNNLHVFSSNSEHSRHHRPDMRDVVSCSSCGKKTRNENYCSIKCSRLGSRKVERPSEHILAQDISTMSWLAIGRKYGVSDNAVRKWARIYGLLE